MEEKVNMSEVIDEIKGANEDDLKKVIEDWFSRIRTEGMKVGAIYISAAIYGTMQKHLKKASPSLRDYKRMTDDILKIISVQLQQQETLQNDSEEVTEEVSNDGTVE